MTRLLALFIVFSLSLAISLAENATASDKIIVDASKDGGVWWFPQKQDGFDPAKDHQGKRLADYLKSRGWDVEEIARGEDITERLEGAAMVIRAGLFGRYKESEVRAYREYVSGGGKVLLLQGFVRKDNMHNDKVAKEFDIVFSETVRRATIKRWAQHPLTNDLPLLRYRIGSIVTESPKSTLPIAYLDNNQIVMGIVTSGKGKIVFVSTILPLLQVPQPFTKRVLDELTSKN